MKTSHFFVLAALTYTFGVAMISCGDNSSSSVRSPSDNEKSDTAVPVVNTRDVDDKITDTIARDKTHVDDGNIPPQKVEVNMRLVVSFISRGFGIDHKVKTDFEQWLATKPNVKYEVHPWGKEGELNYCFALSELSTSDQDAFVKEVRQQLVGRDMVFINENTRCDNWHR